MKKVKREKNNFKLWREYINDSFIYIRDSKKYIYLMIILFLFFAVIGFYVIPMSAELSALIDQNLRDILIKTEELRGINLILFIFMNNSSVSFMGIFLGILLGIFPFVSIIANGSVLGYVFARVYEVTGEVGNFWMILPHGIFELPAVFISYGLGVKLGTAIFSKKPVKEFKRRFIGSVKVFFFVILPLLILAAVIEGILITLYK